MTKRTILCLVACVLACSMLMSWRLASEEKAPADRQHPVVTIPDVAAGASDIYRIEDGFIDAHGVLIYYKAFGKGEPLVILHGGPGASHDYFLPYLIPLARNHRLIFIDERGSGKSQKLQD